MGILHKVARTGKERQCCVAYLATPQLSEYLQIGQHHETQWCHVRHQEKARVVHFGVNLSWKENSNRKGAFKYTSI